MANPKLDTQSIERMICKVVENTKIEILNNKEDKKIYDIDNTLRLINELSTNLPQILAAADIPSNNVCYHTIPTGWKLQIDATLDLKINEQGCIVCEKSNNVKYFLIDIEFKSHHQNDNIINELDIASEYRHVNYPPLDGCSTLPQAIDSKMSAEENYSTFTFDKSNQILKHIAKMNFFEGIHIICNWERN